MTAIACEFNEDYNKYWIENKNKIHLIGKDILRPHAVYWPAFLIAFNYTRKEVEEMADLNEDIAKILPTTVFAHGWLTNNGQKISKSLGNAILPSTEIEWIMNEFNLDLDIARDYFKYYLITATNFGNDGDYSRDRFVEKVNSELANKIGNLTKRTLDMIYKNCNQHIPKPEKIDNIFKDDISIYQEYLESFRFNEYVFEIMKNAEEANRYLEENAPWKLAKDNKIKEMENVLYSIANVIRKIAILLQPISPYVAERILKELNISFEDNIAFDKLNENLEFNLEILKPTIIIPRMQKK